MDSERRTLEWLNAHDCGRPTAFFVVNDTLCVGVIRALRKKGLSVPEDVAVMGCADFDFARMLSEPLTSINQDSHGMGKRAVQLGIGRLEGRAPAEPVYEIHPHRLVERMTTRGTRSHTASAGVSGTKSMKSGKKSVLT